MLIIMNMKANYTFESMNLMFIPFFIPWKGKRVIKAEKTGAKIKLIMGGRVKWQYCFILVRQKREIKGMVRL